MHHAFNKKKSDNFIEVAIEVETARHAHDQIGPTVIDYFMFLSTQPMTLGCLRAWDS